MKKLITYLMPILNNQIDQQSIYETKNRRLFVYIMIMTTIAVIPFIIVNIILSKFVYATIDLLAVAFFLFNMIYYKKSGNYKLAFSFQIIFSTVLLASIHAVSYQVVAVNLIWVPLLILTSFYMAGKNIGTKLSFIILGIMLLAETIPSYLHIPQEFLSSQDVRFFTILHLTVSAIVSIALCFRITNEEYNLFNSINKKNIEINKAHQFNSTLLKTLSHDLSNPLTTIDHLIEMIFKKEEEQTRFTILKLNKINFHVNRMFEIVQQAKTFNALDSGKKNVVLEKVILDTAINRSILSIESQAKAKNIKLHKKYYNRNHKIMAELSSLTNNVLNNILSNAIKFSPKDSTIDICIKPLKEKLQLSIIDRGQGMPEKIIQNIFSPSAQTTRIGTNGEAGTGFGMPIVKMFLDRYGAEIRLESKEVKTGKNKNDDFIGTKVIIEFKKAA